MSKATHKNIIYDNEQYGKLNMEDNMENFWIRFI